MTDKPPPQSQPFSMPSPFPPGSLGASINPEKPAEKRPSLAARAASSRPAWLVVGVALVELIRAIAEAWPKH